MTSVTEQTTSKTTPKTSPDDQLTLYKAVTSAVYALGSGLSSESTHASSKSKATLARLRQAAGTTPGVDPIAWGLVLEDLLKNLPDHEIGRTDKPSDGEWAAFTSLTMFAIHQQSQAEFMHQKQSTIGRAVGELKNASNSESIKARLDALQTAQSKKAIQYHLRSIINLLSSYDIPLDYGLLAQDLKMLVNPKLRPGVIIRWGRDYVRATYRAS